MAVQVWIGDRPEHPNERRAIVALANGLERLESLYLLLANFNVGGRTIDLAIIKHDAIFIVELKHCDGKIFGGVNGPWYVESANNERKRLNPGRKNPYNQVISYYYSLTNYLNDHREQIFADHRAHQVNFRSCRRVVVIAPHIQEGSEIELDWKVELKGLDELPAFLVTERSAELDLSREEMLAIPEVLGCTRWKDINALIAGVLPNWSAEPAAPEQQPAVEANPAPVAPEATSTEPPLSWSQQLRQSWQSTTGRIAWGTGILATFLFVILVWQQVSSLSAVGPPPRNQNDALSTPISGAVGSVVLGDIEDGPAACVWSGFQSVGKRWDNNTQRWLSVGVGGTVVELEPDVVVTLETVDYCDAHIRLTWSVRNNSDQRVTFPLSDTNIQIRDPIGNEYTIDSQQSEPAVVTVLPDSQEHGEALVPRPVSQNAPSLLVRLREKPFGEASWLVFLEGN